MEHCEILIIGGGAAGISAAKEAVAAGCTHILLVERKQDLGGILGQCLHRGFGNGRSGPEYVKQMLEDFPQGVRCLTGTTVVALSQEKTATLKQAGRGEFSVAFQQLILAAGCLEIPAGALPIAGTRPQGVYTAGQMQEMMNLHGFRPQGPVAILGSGDLGLIMARHLQEAGIPVAAIIEKKDRCGAMGRNQQFLPGSGIELLCGTTVTEILGYPRLEGVALSQGRVIPCRTLLVAVGFRPDRTLCRHPEKESWVHLCGNCRKIYPMVEGVLADSRQAALQAVAALGKGG